MNEFKYYDIPSPFPTLARGLFTRELETEGEKKYQIVVRGYDKFFNIGEVPWTTVRFYYSFLKTSISFFLSGHLSKRTQQRLTSCLSNRTGVSFLSRH